MRMTPTRFVRDLAYRVSPFTPAPVRATPPVKDWHDWGGIALEIAQAQVPFKNIWHLEARRILSRRRFTLGGLGTRLERLARSRVLGSPFVIINAFTNWDVSGRQILFEVMKQAQAQGRGVLTVSNHLSMFDDPLVFMGLFGIYDFSAERKCWWSTACAMNFNPQGADPRSRITRYFSEVSNMIFILRPSKLKTIGGEPAVWDSPLEDLQNDLALADLERLSKKAKASGMLLDDYVGGYYTGETHAEREEGVNAFLNQQGMIEIMARLDAGQHVHMFLEGTRSREAGLSTPKMGIGKAMHHAPEAIVVPIYFRGTENIMPIGSYLPRLGQEVAVRVGSPIPAHKLEALRANGATHATYGKLSQLMMNDLQVLERRVRASSPSLFPA